MSKIEGWKLVPIKPTPEMCEAGATVDPERESVWAAYLAAAPVPPAQAPVDERAAFEAWGSEYFNYGFQPATFLITEYEHEGTQMAWEGWQARASLAAPAAQPAAPVADLTDAQKAAPELLAALKAILPFVPVSSAKDGGAVKYSANVVAADAVRAAIALATGSKS